ncbi:hypothetical protein D9611_003840 [Ephemerocybe angulata]|uniref:Uncharacterized protein n=1 Tax=Ephemerocybe angulata TaxID=980116 RepID=A0A8H5EYN2_9AGAR|nr:hypothetical protein D9611_003840 [Tulosesus angulatus]
MDSDKKLARFSDVPEDIGRTIFETAAENGDGYRCALISRKVKLWVEPILYRNVTVYGNGLFARTIRDEESTKPPDFFATHVKTLLFEHTSRREDVPIIVRKCHRAWSIGFWIAEARIADELRELVTTDLLTPTQLSVGGRLFPANQLHFSHPIFRNVTHLDVMGKDSFDWEWESLLQLKKLTHFSLDVQVNTQQNPFKQAQRILAFCPESLRVFILTEVGPGYGSWTDRGDSEIVDIARAFSNGEVDPRAITAYTRLGGEYEYAIPAPYHELLDEWADPSNVRCNLWTRAEDLIKRRRMKPKIIE